MGELKKRLGIDKNLFDNIFWKSFGLDLLLVIIICVLFFSGMNFVTGKMDVLLEGLDYNILFTNDIDGINAIKENLVGAISWLFGFLSLSFLLFVGLYSFFKGIIYNSFFKKKMKWKFYRKFYTFNFLFLFLELSLIIGYIMKKNLILFLLAILLIYLQFFISCSLVKKVKLRKSFVVGTKLSFYGFRYLIFPLIFVSLCFMITRFIMRSFMINILTYNLLVISNLLIIIFFIAFVRRLSVQIMMEVKK
jgi:hypothetical protein